MSKTVRERELENLVVQLQDDIKQYKDCITLMLRGIQNIDEEVKNKFGFGPKMNSPSKLQEISRRISETDKVISTFIEVDTQDLPPGLEPELEPEPELELEPEPELEPELEPEPEPELEPELEPKKTRYLHPDEAVGSRRHWRK